MPGQNQTSSTTKNQGGHRKAKSTKGSAQETNHKTKSPSSSTGDKAKDNKSTGKSSEQGE